jgi:predicted amidophosphoribosyltransferase
MPKIRKYRRGHNHTESIANNLSDILSLESSESELYTHASLFAKRQVSTQSRYERLKNKKNTFYTKNRNLNTHILLIDDVTTTGATLLEARKTLEKAGATHVYAYTLAH